MMLGEAKRAVNGVHVPAGRDRFGAILQLANWRFECKVSSHDTAGDYCIYDTIRTARGGPPMHVHHSQDEWFYVREGRFIFKIGEETFHLEPGDSVLGPRQVPHAFASLSDASAVMIVFQPAGTIERLFFEISEVGKLRQPTLQDWQDVARGHDVEIVGPPLTVPS